MGSSWIWYSQQQLDAESRLRVLAGLRYSIAVMLALPNWSPHPRQSPMGFAGVFVVIAFLLLSLSGMQHSRSGMAVSVVFFLAGVGLCLFSLLREKSKLYGYTGVFGTVLYLAANLMASLVGPGR